MGISDSIVREGLISSDPPTELVSVGPGWKDIQTAFDVSGFAGAQPVVFIVGGLEPVACYRPVGAPGAQHLGLAGELTLPVVLVEVTLISVSISDLDKHGKTQPIRSVTRIWVQF
ncbi:MAG TPA: hypothetical protein PLK94_12500 [Alphaproteobacteria bacterium]|nr:hypothetical protein [Alphaproteobacteria bacterium]